MPPPSALPALSPTWCVHTIMHPTLGTVSNRMMSHSVSAKPMAARVDGSLLTAGSAVHLALLWPLRLTAGSSAAMFEACGPPTAVGYPPTAVACTPAAIAYPPTAVSYPPTAVDFHPTAVGCTSVTLQTPSITLRPPSVTLPSLSVTLPSLSVTLQLGSVSQDPCRRIP